MNILRFELLLLAVFFNTTKGLADDGTDVWKPDRLNLKLTPVSVDEKTLSFITHTASEIACALECKRRALSCSWIGFKRDTRECRGYYETSLSVGNSNVWTLVEKPICRLQGYTFHRVFKTCIRLYNTKVTWFEAYTSCRRENAYLIITDNLEKAEAYSTALQGRIGWVGLYDYSNGTLDRDFRWINGDPFTSSSPLWSSNEPSGKSELCGEVGRFGGRLNDLICDQQVYFSCQESI